MITAYFIIFTGKRGVRWDPWNGQQHTVIELSSDIYLYHFQHRSWNYIQKIRSNIIDPLTVKLTIDHKIHCFSLQLVFIWIFTFHFVCLHFQLIQWMKGPQSNITYICMRCAWGTKGECNLKNKFSMRNETKYHSSLFEHFFFHWLFIPVVVQYTLIGINHFTINSSSK